MAITEEDIGFLEIIDDLEPKAHCLRANVACAIVREGQILTLATNDWHPETNCAKIGCIRDIKKVKSGTRREVCYGLCAEQWAIARCAKEGISIQGATCYVTKHPCRVCESLLTESGIVRVVYQEGYPDAIDHFNLFEKRGIIVEKGPNTKQKSPHIPKSHTV